MQMALKLTSKAGILACAVILAAAGCARSSDPAGGLALAAHASTAGADGGRIGNLKIGVKPGPRARRLQSLPTSWNQAVVTFQSSTALTGPSVVTVPFANFTFVNPYYEYNGSSASTPVLPVLRPSTDYVISTNLETLAPLTLQGYGSMPGLQTVNAGANSFLITCSTTGDQGAEIAVDTPAGIQSSPSVAYDSTSNQYIVVWVDGGNVYARRYDTTGAALGAGRVQVNGNAGSAQSAVVAYNLTANAYLVAWQDSRNGHSDVYARSFNASDTLGTEGPVTNTAGTANATQPAIAAASGADRFLVAWTDDRNNATGGLDVYAARVSSAVVNSGEISIATSASVTNQTNPVVLYTSVNDSFLVAFEDDSATNLDLRYQRVTSTTGATQDGTSGAALTTATGNQDQPTLAYNGTDSLVLAAWRDARSGGADIYYNVLNPSTGAFSVTDTALISSASNKSQPHAGFGSLHKDYIVVYSDDRNAGDVDLFEQRLKHDGVTTYGEKVVSNVTGAQRINGLVYGSTGDLFLGAWEDDRAGAASTDIYAQLLR